MIVPISKSFALVVLLSLLVTPQITWSIFNASCVLNKFYSDNFVVGDVEHCGEDVNKEILIDLAFQRYMFKMDKWAKECNVTVMVCNSFKKLPLDDNGKFSPVSDDDYKLNNVMGHAIDIRLITPNMVCGDLDLKEMRDFSANCFLHKVIEYRYLRWGGMKLDLPCHIDDNKFEMNRAYAIAKTKRLQMCC